MARHALSWHGLIVFLRNYPGISDPSVRDTVNQAGRDAWIELERRVKVIAARSGMQNLLPSEARNEVAQTVLADPLLHEKRGRTTDSAYAQFVRRKVRNEAIAKIRSRVLALLVGLREIGVFSTPEPANLPLSERQIAGLAPWFDQMPDEDRFLLHLALTKGVTAASIREMAEQTGMSQTEVTATLVRLFARLRR